MNILNAASAIVFLVSSIYGGPMANSTVPTTSPAIEFKEYSVPTITEEKSIDVEKEVRKYFAEIPELIEVAKCESNFRQFNENREVLRGLKNAKDVGVMQINEDYHKDSADVLELDLNTLEGNMAYAKALYLSDGLTPWKHSSPCWGSKVTYYK